jgi:hypothetical protein
MGPLAERRPLLAVRRAWIVLVRAALPLWFLAWSAGWLAFHVGSAAVGLDARIYAAAARAWLEGQNPWTATVLGVTYAAPPPTLVAFVPFGWLPDGVTAGVWVVGSIAAGLWMIRRLRLPWWWILFPPLSSGAMSGNPDVLVAALLVAGGPAADTAALLLKVYAAGPLLGERRWKSLAAGAGCLAASLLVLPWATYIAQFPTIAETLRVQSTGLSAWGSVPLMTLALISLGVLGWRRAGWFAVPAVWPSTQAHYATIAMPGLAEFRSWPLAAAAALFALPYAGAPVLATAVLAGSALVRPRARGDVR